MPDMNDLERQQRLAMVNEARNQLAFQMQDMIKNPAKYNNADVLDALRDKCKKAGLQFVVKAQKDAPNILHIFVRDPLIEPLDLRAGSAHANPVWLGFVERNNNPTT